MFWFRNSPRSCCLRIVLLDEQHLDYDCKLSDKGNVVLDWTLNYLHLNERQYFGMRYVDDHDQVHWLDTTKSLRKQLRICSEPYVFYFCVKFYAADPARLEEEVTRYQFYLQLKSDILNDLLPAPFPVLVELHAYHLQSEMGSYVRAKHQPGYASECTNFAPELTDRLLQAIEAKHQTLQGQAAAVAECRFLDRARRLTFYGIERYPVLPDVSGDSASYCIGFSPVGVILIKNGEIWDTCAWSIILKLTKDSYVNWPISGRHPRAGTITVQFRAVDGTNKSFGFHLDTKEAYRHMYKTVMDHWLYWRKNRGEEVRTPSLSSRIIRLGSLFRTSSRAESDTTSAGTASGSRRCPPSKFERPASQGNKPQQRSRLQSSPIHEDESMPMVPQDTSTGTMRRRPVNHDACAETNIDEVRHLRRAPVMLEPRGRSVVPSFRRSVSPVSMKSSFSTCPPRISVPMRIVEQDNDNDSVFSGSSRMSHTTADGDTLTRSAKRKRSTMGENNSSGASEETDYTGNVQRAGTLRASLGPQRRRGKMAVRNKTHDGLAIREAMSQLNARTLPYGATAGRELSLPDHLAAVMQPAKSMTMIGSVRPGPPLSAFPPFGKSMNSLSWLPPVSPVKTKDVLSSFEIPPLFPVNPSGTLYLNSNTLNPPVTPSAKVKSFEFKFGSPTLSPSRELPVSASWTAGEHRAAERQQESQSPSAIKSKSFDFKIDVQPKVIPPTPATAEEPPRHVRSLSSTSPASSVPVGRRLAARPRLHSDSGFQPRDPEEGPSSPQRGRFDDDRDCSKESSPFLSPFPVIPPPTPFSEETVSSSPPPVSPRSPKTIPSTRLTAKRLVGTGGPPNRNDSFTTAVTGSDMELQLMRPPTDPKLSPAGESPVYDVVYGESLGGTQVKVEADVHMLPSDGGGVYDVVPRDRPGKNSNGRLKSAFSGSQPLHVSTVHNQMYFEMNGIDGLKESQNLVSSPGGRLQTPRKTAYPVRPIPLHPVQVQTPTSAGTASLGRHPLEMVHSVQREARTESSITQNGAPRSRHSSISSQTSPTDENDPNQGAAFKKPTFSLVSKNDNFPMYTDI